MKTRFYLKKSTVKRFVICAAIFVFAFLLSFSNVLYNIDSIFSDRLYQHGAVPNPKIKIVAIDERTIKAYGDDGGDELGQRGAERNDGETDERFAHAERGGDRFRAVNNELSAADDGCGAEDDEDHALQPGERLFLFGFLCAVQKRVSDEHEHIGREEYQKEDGIRAVESSVDQHNEERGGCGERDGHVPFQNIHIRDNGENGRGNTDYDQKVEDIRADDVAEGNVVGAAETCGNADGGCGKAGADRNDRETDDQRGDLQLGGDGRRAVNENIRALDQ